MRQKDEFGSRRVAGDPQPTMANNGERIRVLEVTPSLARSWGGTSKAVSELSDTISRCGADVTIVTTTRGDSGGADSYQPAIATVQDYPESSWAKIWKGHSVGMWRGVEAAVASADVVHIHELWHYPQVLTYMAARRHGRPYIVTVHGMLDRWCLDQKRWRKAVFGSLIQKRILKSASAIQALTSSEVGQIRAFVEHDRIVEIPNGIDLNMYKQLPCSDTLERAYPELQDREVILFLGRIDRKKGLETLIRGSLALKKRDIPFHLLLVGPAEAEYRLELQSLITEVDLEGHVTFTGMLTGNDKLAALGRASVFVLPSYSEGFSIAALEALACRVPVILSRGCSFDEIRAWRAGFIFEDARKDFGEILVKVITCPDISHESRENGLRLVRDRFSLDVVGRRMFDLYHSVVR